MIEGLERTLDSLAGPGLPELRSLLQDLLGGPSVNGRFLGETMLLRPRVYRLRFVVDDCDRSLIAKRLPLHLSHREQRVVQRWLPAVGLGHIGPPVLGIAADRRGRCTWHVYRDLGDETLNRLGGHAPELCAAVDLLAQLHSRFAGHPLLGECRVEGGDLGFSFYSSSVRDAIRSLEALRSPELHVSLDDRRLVDRLLQRLGVLIEEEPHRAQVVADQGGPETLLHGDLWTTNVYVQSTGNGPKALLIDWDHVGVGRPSYDLSTFLNRLEIHDRDWVLSRYEDATRHLGFSPRSASSWNHLFETAELARLANCIIWPALAAGEGQADWALDELGRINQWFELLEPVLS